MRGCDVACDCIKPPSKALVADIEICNHPCTLYLYHSPLIYYRPLQLFFNCCAIRFIQEAGSVH